MITVSAGLDRSPAAERVLDPLRSWVPDTASLRSWVEDDDDAGIDRPLEPQRPVGPDDHLFEHSDSHLILAARL